MGRRGANEGNGDVVRETRGEIGEQFVTEARVRDGFKEEGTMSIVSLLRGRGQREEWRCYQIRQLAVMNAFQ